ncbi:FctA domain-containing protein [Olsenella sp. YH-ols2221]|uniref:DUF7601 domain-containing protein n=1 Tax=Olsenella kribbiana TaxID=3115221 RepID=UPI002ED94614
MKFTTKKFGSIATAAVLAGTMAFMPATAFAVSFNDEASSTVAGTTVLNKEWDAASATQFNNTETFKFDVKYIGGSKVGSWDYTESKLSTDTKIVTLSSEWAKNAAGTVSKASLDAKTLLAGYNFTTPGVYNFEVKEENTSNPNIKYDDNTYTVTVVVTMPEDYPTNSTPVIESVGVQKTVDGKTTKTPANFKNTAAKNDSLKVSKKVAGAAANTGDQFTYKLTLEGAKGSYDYVITGDGATENDKGTIKSGDTFYLKHNQQIEIKNLPENAKYTVEETDTQDYDSTDIKDSDEAESTVKKGTTPTAKGTISADGDTVAFTNNKGFASQTGITMNTLPFVAVATVAVAGGAALVISRRRHAGEDF